MSALTKNAYGVLNTLKAGKVPAVDVRKIGPSFFGRLRANGYAAKAEDGSWSITKAGREALAQYNKAVKADEREAKKVAKATKTAAAAFSETA